MSEEYLNGNDTNNFKVQMAQFKGEVTAEIRQIVSGMKEIREEIRCLATTKEVSSMQGSITNLNTSILSLDSKVNDYILKASVENSKQATKIGLIMGGITLFVSAVVTLVLPHIISVK
jgi:prefoldin subunit 5